MDDASAPGRTSGRPLAGTGIDSQCNALVLPALLIDPPQIPDERVLDVLAGSLWTEGRIAEALTCLRLLKLREPLSGPHQLAQGFWDLYLGRAASARDGFLAALKECEPGSARDNARLGYAFAMFHLEAYDEAQRAFAELARDAPAFNSPAVMAAASAELAQGRRPAQITMAPLPGLPPGLSEALQTKTLRGAEAAIALAESFIGRHAAQPLPLWRFILESHLDLGHDQHAVELAARLTAAYADDGPLTYLHAIALRRIGRKDSSYEAFERVCHMLSPLEARAWGGLAASHAERAELDLAAARYRIAIFLDGSNPHFWGDLGQVELARGRDEEAHRACDKAIELGRRSFDNYYHRGLSALRLGRDLAGIQDWALALQADPRDARAGQILQHLAHRSAQVPDQRFCFGEITRSGRGLSARRSNNDKRRLLPAQEAADLLLPLLASATYVGSPKHKAQPHLFGLPAFQGRRGDASLCDEDAGFLPQHMSYIPELLKLGVLAGLVGARNMIWAIDDRGWIFECRLSNPQQREYHGYPVRRSEPIAAPIYPRFASWAETQGTDENKRTANRCKTRYGFK
jgi:tetratricopeptide (TPR) repeat protein